AVGGIGQARHAIAVYLPRLYAGHAHMPVVVRTIGHRIEAYHACWPDVVFPVKEQQLHACGAAGEQTKIDATINDRGAKRRAVASIANRIHGCSFSSVVSQESSRATPGWRSASVPPQPPPGLPAVDTGSDAALARCGSRAGPPGNRCGHRYAVILGC